MIISKGLSVLSLVLALASTTCQAPVREQEDGSNQRAEETSAVILARIGGIT